MGRKYKRRGRKKKGEAEKSDSGRTPGLITSCLVSCMFYDMLRYMERKIRDSGIVSRDEKMSISRRRKRER